MITAIKNLLYDDNDSLSIIKVETKAHRSTLLLEDNVKNIRKRNNGLYEARKTINGETFSFYDRNLQKLKKKLSVFLQGKGLATRRNSSAKFYEYSINWSELYKKPFVSEKQYKAIVNALEKIKNTDIDIPVKYITTENLQSYLNTIPNTRSKEILILYLNASLKRAVKEGYLKYNPMEDVQKAPKLNNIRKPFTYDEQVKLLEAIKGTIVEEYILIYLFTGIRKNEFNIKTIKEDIVNNVLRVESEKKRSLSPVYRFIDLPVKTVALIKNAKLEYSIEHIGKEFRKILKTLNFESGYGIHTLRHTFTTNHFYLGTQEKFLQEWLGHEKLETTKKHYMAIDRSLSKEKILELYNGYYYIK